jgi:hypothetical protein
VLVVQELLVEQVVPEVEEMVSVVRVVLVELLVLYMRAVLLVLIHSFQCCWILFIQQIIFQSHQVLVVMVEQVLMGRMVRQEVLAVPVVLVAR